MASYTIELRKVIDLYGREEVKSWFEDYDLANFLTPEQIEQITKFNVWSKDRLADKILDYYYMREIGFETPALFKHYAKITMKMIMERYLPKIYSKFLEYDPLSNVDFTEEFTREIIGESEASGSSTSNSNQEAEGFNIINNTPQKRITKQDLDTGAYASQTNQSDTQTNINDTTNTSNSGNSKTIEKFTRHEEGDNGVIITNQRLVKEYREIIVAIDEEIIYELGSLFMAIY
ncbi:MAG: hypothetical protein J6S85_20125 [Methanobrevibacter sp.]|nr:hypothetical protein [Methanobrevibacter sp.]